MGRLDNKVAVVTGGASNPSLGRSMSIAFAREGAKVILTDIDTEGGKKVEDEILSSNGEAFFIEHDVTSTQGWSEVKNKTIEKYSKIDILVNNAGITKDGLILRMTEDQWDQVIETNLKGIFNYSKAVARPMMKNRGGSIINMGSIVGLTGNAGQSNYAASKAGLVGFTKSYAKELASRNVRANVVAPGYILTDMTDALDEKVLEGIKEATPLGRAGNVDEVAAACLFLASDLSSYITGEVIRVDGGMAI